MGNSLASYDYQIVFHVLFLCNGISIPYLINECWATLIAWEKHATHTMLTIYIVDSPTFNNKVDCIRR